MKAILGDDIVATFLRLHWPKRVPDNNKLHSIAFYLQLFHWIIRSMLVIDSSMHLPILSPPCQSRRGAARGTQNGTWICDWIQVCSPVKIFGGLSKEPNNTHSRQRSEVTMIVVNYRGNIVFVYYLLILLK